MTIMKANLVCKHHATTLDNKGETMSVCKLGLFEGSPSLQECMSCESYEGKVRGLGDVIAKATKAFGVKPCSKCKERQKKLNKAVPCKSCQQKTTDVDDAV